MYAFGTTQVLQNAKLSMDVSAKNQKTSFLLTISGTLTPAQSGTVTIYETINGSYIETYSTTLSSGAYSYQLRVYNGTYEFYANWPGNSQYNAAVSSVWTGTLNTAIPEFPDPLILLAMFMLVTLLTIAIYKKRHNDS
jgi:hypothetical protein